ncbi:MAG: aldehyde dehydrogenase family protein, partial [Acidobacteria bacterium]|nr:aldehyde dehydrogenase family protein [Acidobacteriota bacterium]
MSNATATGTRKDMKMFIDGESVDSASGDRTEVRNPATGEVVATVPKANAADARRAIDAAEAALEQWSETTAEERSRILNKAHDITHDA